VLSWNCVLIVPVEEMIKLVKEVITYVKPPIKPPAIPELFGKYNIVDVKKLLNKVPEQMWIRNKPAINKYKFCTK